MPEIQGCTTGMGFANGSGSALQVAQAELCSNPRERPMHYTKPMIELVFEIRRRANAHTKPGIKLANPNLLTELGEIYRSSKDTILRTLIKELLTVAGNEWLALQQEPVEPRKKSTVKVYRGKVSLTETPPATEPGGLSSSGTARYYRGVKIA
jgi:hypothetical protein